MKYDFFAPDAELSATEIGDGNINYVFRIEDKKNAKSLVIKQADKFLRSCGRPLDVLRSKIEAEILSIQSELVPSFIPKIYFYDDVMCALCYGRYFSVQKFAHRNDGFQNFFAFCF